MDMLAFLVSHLLYTPMTDPLKMVHTADIAAHRSCHIRTSSCKPLMDVKVNELPPTFKMYLA
jgi:hypothetical protein